VEKNKMIISHNLKDKKIEKIVRKETGFLLSNKSGGFLSLGLDSRYSGLFFNINNKLFKIIDDIIIPGKVKKITNNFWNTERTKDNIKESFFLPMLSNTFVYELSHHTHIDLLLDVREAYDNRKWGKNYEVFVERQKIVVKFSKTNDPKDGDQINNKEYTIYLVIEGDEDIHYKKIGQWIEKEYSYDKKRNSPPFKTHVYNAMKLLSKKLIFSVSTNKEEALDNAEKVLNNLTNLKDMQKKYSELNLKLTSKPHIGLAYNSAIKSLDSLLIHNPSQLGIYAGLPWFFQIWSRDEAISLKALIQEKEFEVAKNILNRQLRIATEDGRIPNRFPPTETASADSVGWNFKRWHDLIKEISKNELIEKYFDKLEFTELILKLKSILNSNIENYTEEGLATNSYKETWMDTLGRPGKNIEIQALRLVMLNLLVKLSNDEYYKKLELDLKNKVKKEFLENRYLKDNLNNEEIRPNLFIAAYLYPDLLSKKEWETCFDTIIPKLWLKWGGISTIDRNSKLFNKSHSGEDPKSYHNGDSWFWINNLAALVLFRTNKDRYSAHISKIIEASTNEILWSGLISHHAELSSASNLKSEGCLCQAWSNALYIELINEIYQ